MAQREHHQQAGHQRRPGPADDNQEASANGAADGRAGADGLTELQAQLAEERNRAEGYLAQWQRAAADYQNFKRRTEQEREEMARLANMALIINVLPAVDDLDRALNNVDATLAGL